MSKSEELFYRWLMLKIQGKGIAEYLVGIGLQRIAIYGIGNVGKMLLYELKNSPISIACLIDMQADKHPYLENDIVFLPDADFPSVDAIIITPIYSFDSIKRSLSNRVQCPMISMEDIISNMMEG